MQVVRMPQMGWTMESAEIVKWLKQESESVAFGEPLLEVQTDKTNVEVESPTSGTLVRVLARDGETIRVGVPIAVIVEEGEQVHPSAIEAILKKSAGGEAGVSPTSSTGAVTTASASLSPAGRASAPSDVRATPRVRKLAKELGVDIGAVTPTGPGGSVTEEDIRRHAAGGRPKVRERVRLTGVRKAMASHMLQSWQAIPHFHQIIDVEAEALIQARAKHQVSLTVFFVRAAAIALERHPWINAIIEENEVLLLDDVNVGVAVETESGLVVPVIHHANRKSWADIAAELDELSRRARASQLTPEQLSGGTFTVSNLGMYGIETGTPIINAPQVALMFVGCLQKVPVVSQGQVVEGQRVKVTLSYDHRIIDGVMAAGFSQEIRQLLQAPEQLEFK